MRISGLLIIVVALVVPIYWYSDLAARYSASALFSLYLGSAALIAMSVSQMLSTRVRGVEMIFGGLDKIYVLHKWLGFGAIIAILLHDTIDADIDGLGRETILTEIAETFGEFSLYAFLVLVVITIATIIPYRLWYWTHRFMGALFALSAIHYLFILKPFANASPLGIYIAAFCIVGVLCYLYTLIPFDWLQGRHSYKITNIEKTGDALAVSLSPLKNGLRHKAGQFTFVKFNAPGLSEVHPFTISAAPKLDRSLRVTIKRLGDYTDKLDGTLKPGAKVTLSNAYGHFHSAKSKTSSIWIAGGIGVTPFIAWAQTLNTDAGPVDFFYCVHREGDAAHLSELQEIVAKKPNLNLHLIVSEHMPRLSPAQIAARVETPLKSAHVYFCGPDKMRDSLRAGLGKIGLKHSHFHVEQFEIRSGLGLLKMAGWIKKLFRAFRGNQTTRSRTNAS